MPAPDDARALLDDEELRLAEGKELLADGIVRQWRETGGIDFTVVVDPAELPATVGVGAALRVFNVAVQIAADRIEELGG